MEGVGAFVTAWDTDLGRWRLAWVEYMRGGPVAAPVESADEAFAREIALAHSAVDPHGMPMGLYSPDDVRAAVEDEVCDDERDADAAVGVMPVAALVYAEPGGVA